MTRFRIFLISAVVVLTGGFSASASEIPADDPAFFTYLFSQKSIPENWIFKPASDELTPAMLEEIANRLAASGGKYQRATKSAVGWVLDFQNGTARARILRAPDHTLIGVFFSRLE